MNITSFTLRTITTSIILASAFNSYAASKGGTLVYCSEGSPAGFDTTQYTTGTDIEAGSNVLYNGLVSFTRGETTVAPKLAEKWDVSADGLEWTFHLRKGVKFHSTKYFAPTRDFNADDVMATYNRMMDPNNAFQKANPVNFPYFAAMGFKTNIKSLEKIDDYTVKFTLNNVDASFIQTMAMPTFIILSGEYMDKLLKEGNTGQINQEPIGTGPFQFVRYQKDAQIRYKANTKYWDKEEGPKVDNLIFSITKDPSVRAQKLKANECQVMGLPQPADLLDLAKDKNLKIIEKSGFNVGFIYYNTEKKPFDDAKVRQALDMAINKEQIIKAVYGGGASVAVNPMPKTQWSFNKDIKPYPNDIDAAKKLLAQAGYPNGFETTLWTLPVTRPYNPNGRLMGELIQSDWKKIGVKVTLQTYEWGEYLKRAQKGEHQTIMVGWSGDNGDPDNWLNTLFGCGSVGSNNYSRFCYKPFEDLILKAKLTTDMQQRTQLYEQAQVIFHEQMPASPIASSIFSVPMNKKVQGLKAPALGGNLQFYGVSIDK